MPNTYNVHDIEIAPGYVIVKPHEVDKEVAGIIQPGKEKEVPQWGEVVKVGEKTDENQLTVKPGQTVIYKKWQTNDVKVGDKKYYFLKYEEVIGAVK